MTTRSNLTLDEWQLVKTLFRRTVSKPVTLEERRIIRSCTAKFRERFKSRAEKIQVLPTCTLEWSSTSFSIGRKRLALVDVEQAKAISFLLAKSMMYERPVFSYVEFMVRAAEAFYSAGQHGVALRVAKKANSTLRSYARCHGALPFFPRPFSPDKTTLNAITSNLVLAFVTGHEIGHIMQGSGDDQSEIEAWVKSVYDRHETEKSHHFDAQMNRFLKPECVQKFDINALPCGDIVQSIKFAKRWDHLKALQLSEAHSDVFGLLALTDVASKVNTPPDIAASALVGLLEFSEMLMAFRRLLPRLPKKGQRTNVAFEPTNLGFRRFMLVQAIEAVRNREIPVPKEVTDFWNRLPEERFNLLSNVNNSGQLFSVSNRSIHLARAALIVSSTGSLPEAPQESEILERFGPLAGDGFFLASCLKFPERWVKIEQHHDWGPNENDECVPMGYGSAIHDISKLVRKTNASLSAENIIRRTSNLSQEKMIQLIRHPRTQVFNRRIIGTWPHKVMKQI
ncbi:hypothetical protein [Ruegeria arenilitoris]|uniref:hypothetical protein n=1 Tax=Ruegeria arenilitoris TaxID=1173585 RepID=UPI00147BF280|nr:hypothetical protein [Ruegeria arenilitoris]